MGLGDLDCLKNMRNINMGFGDLVCIIDAKSTLGMFFSENFREN